MLCEAHCRYRVNLQYSTEWMYVCVQPSLHRSRLNCLSSPSPLSFPLPPSLTFHPSLHTPSPLSFPPLSVPQSTFIPLSTPLHPSYNLHPSTTREQHPVFSKHVFQRVPGLPQRPAIAQCHCFVPGRGVRAVLGGEVSLPSENPQPDHDCQWKER